MKTRSQPYLTGNRDAHRFRNRVLRRASRTVTVLGDVRDQQSPLGWVHTSTRGSCEHLPRGGMADLGTSPNTVTVRDARRSTRISESVRVSVSGQSKVGSAFSELTLTLAVNATAAFTPHETNIEPDRGDPQFPKISKATLSSPPVACASQV